MCLITRQKTALTAKKDITVYKILRTFTGKSEEAVIGGVTYIMTPKLFRSLNGRQTYGIGIVYESEINHSFNMYSRKYEIEEAFHAYTNTLAWVKREAKGSAVAECVIPRGSKYYLGTNNGTSKGIASNRIKVVRIIQ